MPNSPDDILFGASVDDQTGKFFDDFNTRLNGLDNKMKQGFAGIDSMSGKSVLGLSAVAGAVGGVAAMIGTKLLDSVGNAAAAMQNLVKESTLLAARNETLGVSLEIVGQNAGYSKEELKGYEEGLKKTGISILESKQGLVSMIQADLDLADAAKLARVSQDAAVLAGLNSSETFQRVLRGITTLQPEILRSLNLEVNLQKEVEEYARKNNIAAASIDYATKKQIALNAVLEKGKTIAGAYEAAMGTVGKKLGSLERYKEDFKVLFGTTFLPAFGAGVDFIIKKLEEMKKWIEENKESLETFGAAAKTVVEGAIKLFEQLIGVISSIPGYIVDISGKIAQAIANSGGNIIPDISDSELEKRKAKLGVYFGQVVALAAGSIAYIGVFVGEAVDSVISVGRAAAAALSGDFDKANDIMYEAAERFLSTPERAKDAFGNAALEAGKFVGVVEEVGDAADDASSGIDKMAKATEALAEATIQANNLLAEFAKKMEEEAAELAIKAAREAQETAMREAWELEDLARQHAERVAAIMENAAQSQQEAMERHSQERINIEINLQRQLRDIRRRFEFEASELARARDAVGLLQLMRRNRQEVEDARIAAQDQRQDSDRQYQLELRQIEARRRKALQDLARQEVREAEVRERSRQRNRQLQQLHDRWEEEDRRRKYARQLADLLRQIQGMSGMTQSGLNILTTQWSNYFGNLLNMATTYMTYMNRIIVPGGTVQQYNPAGSPGGLGFQTNSVPGGTSSTKVVGQGGQVSQMLADAAKRFKEIGNISRVPAVSSRKSTDRKEISITVEGSGLDPYIQRVVARTLYEIERNKG
jgi:hypothetical protein